MTTSRKVTWLISSLIMLIIATAAAQPSHAQSGPDPSGSTQDPTMPF